MKVLKFFDTINRPSFFWLMRKCKGIMNIMGKALLVDTNFSAEPIYRALKKLGLEVFVIGNNPNDYLAKISENYKQMDYSNEKELLNYILEVNFDYLIPGGNDLSYRVCSWVKTQKRFFNIDSLEVNNTINNKKEFRTYADRIGLNIPKLIKVEEGEQSLPIIVKPVDSYSGQGTTIITKDNFNSLKDSILQAKRYSKSNNYLIEEFVQGQLYSHSAFIRDKKILHDFLVREYCNTNPFAVDSSFVDYSFDKKVLENIRKQILHISNDLELCDGLIHTQFILNNNNFRLIEITRRSPGDLYSRLIEHSTGFPYAEYYVKPFLNMKNKSFDNTLQENNIVRHTLSFKNGGIFHGLNFIKSGNIKQFIPLVLPGDRLEPSPFGRAGLLFLDYDNKDDLDSGLNKIIKGNMYKNEASY